MTQNQNNQQNLEQNLINLINRVDSEFQKITQNLGTNDSAIILNGLTGVGKSTIYNWVLGADFIYDQTLKLDIHNKQYSEMNNGPNPVTQNPIIQKIQATNLCIIDLPGMESSDWLQNLYVDLILEKLSKQVKLKGLYVLNQSSDDLNEERQQKFISFTKKYLLHDVNNIENIILIANKYSGETSVSDFAKKIQEYLIECQDFPNKKPTVHVIKKITNDQQLKEYFSKVAKESLIKDMLQANELNIKVSSFDAHIVNQYLSSKIQGFCKIVKVRIDKLKNLQNQNRQNNQQAELLISQFQNQQMNKLDLLLKMTKYLVQQNNLDDEFNHDDFQNFAEIYSYFVQIEGVFTIQDLVEESLEQSQNSLNDIIQSIQQINLNLQQTQFIAQQLNQGNINQVGQETSFSFYEEVQRDNTGNVDQRYDTAINMNNGGRDGDGDGDGDGSSISVILTTIGNIIIITGAALTAGVVIIGSSAVSRGMTFGIISMIIGDLMKNVSKFLK